MTFNNAVNVIEFEGNRISSQKAHELNFRVNTPIALCGLDFTEQCIDIKICKLDGFGKSHIFYELKARSGFYSIF